ncbi:hypothetical protein D8674_008302 [Pyrus ussuriensis x Pyrus communis]|uniref:Uncharacterized protein n=1 Tax=Pyrus ussuriensis x Pyrus communis TaxID=2448454 RepID=A0A5N5HVF9_9ROSA|nr:hypothetical protein D8674_008302 [Pyrus ussuriensis x Pyrus communis]
MGNARHCETGASSSTSTSGYVALIEKVVELKQQMAVQHNHITTQSAHITTQEAHIAAQEYKMG